MRTSKLTALIAAALCAAPLYATDYQYTLSKSNSIWWAKNNNGVLAYLNVPSTVFNKGDTLEIDMIISSDEYFYQPGEWTIGASIGFNNYLYQDIYGRNSTHFSVQTSAGDWIDDPDPRVCGNCLIAYSGFSVTPLDIIAVRATILNDLSQSVQSSQIEASFSVFPVLPPPPPPPPYVPEPESWTLMITGFGLIGAAIRRRNSLLFERASDRACRTPTRDA